jgi:pilus assembly protein FimV
MVLRKHFLATLGTGLLPVLSISIAHAMTVQPVKVKSAIGEPFYAEIVISDLGQIDIRDIQISLANHQEMSQLGVSGSALSNSLDLSLLATQSNKTNVQGVIVIRSRQPINDPYLEFAVKIKAGPNNRIQRINALIDPKESKKIAINLMPAQDHQAASIELATSDMPTMDSSETVSSTATDTTLNQALIVSNTAPPDMGSLTKESSDSNMMSTKASNQPPKEVDISSSAQKNKQQHLVRRNESLWKIAKQLQPQLNQPIEQIMQNIRALNNDAFIDGNPNQLKRGATLILPERDQNAMLVNNALPPAKPKAVTKLQAAPSRPSNPSHRGRLPKAEMTLVAPTTKGLAQGNSADGRSNGLQPLSRELSLKVGQERRKTVLMQHEVSELDAQLALNDKKIAMLNAKLAEMEHQLKMRNQNQKTSTSVTQKVSQAALPLLAIVAVVLSGFSPNMAQAADGDSSGFPLWIIPIGLLIIAVIFKVLQGKSKETSNKRAAKPKAKRPATRSTPESNTTSSAKPVTPVREAPVAIDRTAPVTPVTDVLQDAQSFIERERFTQAADILKQAIAAASTRIDLQIKLLEVYALQNELFGFEQQYKVVVGFNQASVTTHADKLRQLLQEERNEPAPDDDLSLDFTPSKPQEPLSQAATLLSDQDFNVKNAVPAAADQSLADLEAEFGFDQPLSTQEEIKPTPSSTGNVIEFDLTSFESDKGLELNTAATEQTQSKPAEQPLDLEFDLSDTFDLGDKATQPEALAFETKPETPTSTSNTATEFDLKDIQVEDTNWASGFADQEFDIGANTAPVAPTPVAPAIEIKADTADLSDQAMPNEFLLKEFPFLSSLDVQQTNLELAESYINLGERQSAQELLEEVIKLGNSQQQTQAQQLIRKLAS